MKAACFVPSVEDFIDPFISVVILNGLYIFS